MSFASEHPARPQLGRAMTFEEWAAMPEDEPGELVDGRSEEEEAPDLVRRLVVSGWYACSERGSAGTGRVGVCCSTFSGL
jgi:hypothetical protein